MDLSFPENFSVNCAIDKNFYCGEPIKLTYPTIDMLAERVSNLGVGCKLWKKDLQRFFRQLPLCPRDYSLIGFCWKQLLFFDRSVPMGLTSMAYAVQRSTNCISYIHKAAGYWCLNYLDDFGSAELEENAWKSYNYLGLVLEQIGIKEAKSKAVAPTMRMEFLGNMVDYIKMTIEVSEDHLLELDLLLKKWTTKPSTRKKNFSL